MPHIKLRVSSQSGYPNLLYSQEWVKVIFLHLWPQKLYRAFRFGSLWPISCSYARHSQLTRHSLKLANGRIRQSLTALVVNAFYVFLIVIINQADHGTLKTTHNDLIMHSAVTIAKTSNQISQKATENILIEYRHICFIHIMTAWYGHTLRIVGLCVTGVFHSRRVP